MEIKSFTFNDYQENTYLIIEGKHCIIIDPGIGFGKDFSQNIEYIDMRIPERAIIKFYNETEKKIKE